MNEVVAHVTGRTEYRTRALYQYDYGQTLVIRGIELPEAYEVHFANAPDGQSTTAIGNSGGVAIPDIYLRSGQDVFAWLYLHTGENDGETVYRMVIPVRKRASISSTTPTPVQQDVITQTIAALDAGVAEVQDAVSGVGTAIQAALQEAKDSGEFDGADGVSPAVSVSQITGGHEISITDAQGTETFDVLDGEPGKDGKDGVDGQPGKDGADGKDGQDGHSPVVTASKSGTVTTVSVDGEPIATINDGQDGQPGADGKDGTDGAPGIGVPSGGTQGQMLVKKTGTDYDTEWQNQPSVPVQDVQVNGTSILSQGVANVPMADATNAGAVIIGSGLTKNASGKLVTDSAGAGTVKAGTNVSQPIVPSQQHTAAFYGLAKAAGADMASVSGATVGVYPEAQKSAIQKMLGIYQAPWELIREDTVNNETSEDYFIQVDDNGNPFELTDVVLQITLPANTNYVIGGSGAVDLFYSDNNSKTVLLNAISGPKTNNWYGSVYLLRQGNSSFFAGSTYQDSGSQRTVSVRNNDDFTFSAFTVIKIRLRSIQGQLSYKLYGKRKWAV